MTDEIWVSLCECQSTGRLLQGRASHHMDSKVNVISEEAILKFTVTVQYLAIV